MSGLVAPPFVRVGRFRRLGGTGLLTAAAGATMGRTRAVLSLAAVLTVASPAAASAQPAGHRTLPGTYVVSRHPGVLPEGIGLGPGGVFYVTSLATGAVLRGHLQQPRMTPFIPAGSARRRSAAGVHTDAAGRVYVAGSTALDVYSPHGRLLAHRPAPAGPVGPASLNDLVVTQKAVYVTDFANPVVLRAARHDGRVGSLRPWLNVSAAAPALPAQYWFLNGIDATADGRTLLVSSQGLEKLLRVRVATRSVRPLELGVPFAADGIVLRGRTLYAVLNYDPPAGQGAYTAQLNQAMTGGHVIGAVNAPFDSPTTLAVAGRRLLVVNSQLDHRPGTPPYTVTAVPSGAGTTGQALPASRPGRPTAPGTRPRPEQPCVKPPPSGSFVGW